MVAQALRSPPLIWRPVLSSWILASVGSGSGCCNHLGSEERDIHLFIPQMAAMTRDEPGGSQEPERSLWVSHVGDQNVGIYGCDGGRLPGARINLG